MLSASILAVAALALPGTLASVLKDQLPGVPSGWFVSKTPLSSQAITLKIALKQQNVDQLETLLKSVSDPSSSSYGQYYTADEVTALFNPSNSSVTNVVSWAQKAGFDFHIDQSRHVTIKTTIGHANSVFGANFVNYKDQSTGVEKLRTLQYSIPSDISSHVDFVTPTTFFGRTSNSNVNFIAPVESSERRRWEKLDKRNTSCVQVSASGYRYAGPDCWKSVYNVTYVANASSESRVGFGSFLNESAIYSDLQLFEKLYNIPSQNFSVQLVNGGVNYQESNYSEIGEANLDVQNIVGLGHPLAVTEFITGGSPPFIPNLDEPTSADNENEPYLEYYDYLLSKQNDEIPQVISNSYGDDEQTVPEDYAKRVCNQIGMMGLRGITILESSGDTGVGAPCQSNDGKNTSQFTPTFPGTCPYVVAVGGTQDIDPEVAWDASSGGFSNYFSTAWYQTDAVDTYLQDYISDAVKDYYEPYTNFSGRAFPDIAAHSSDPYWPVYGQGTLGLYSGTSAASPAWAALIGLLNDARFKAGQPAIGFANPLFYSLKSGFTDVTEGGATGCTGVNAQTGGAVSGGIIPWASWNATVGWDPVTGLGLPDFGDLLSTLGLE